MKRNIILSALSIIAILLVSCNRKVEYPVETYATFYETGFNVPETVGEVVVPVLINNPTGAEVQLSVSIQSNDASEGEDYEIVSPASGLLTFSGETDSLAVVINILAHEGEFTGGKNVNLQLSSLTAGVGVGAYNSCKINIVDLDHPLAAFIGTWTGTMGGMYQSASYNTSFDIIADEKDETYTKLIFSTGIDPFFHGMGLSSATYSAEAISATEVVVIAEQPNGYDDVILLGFDAPDPNAASGYDHLYFTLQDDGTLKQENAYGAFTPGQGGFYEIYPGGAVFSKQ